MLLKLAPELSGEALARLASALGGRVDGWVLTNTLQADSGGWSGGPLTELSRERLRDAHALGMRPVISCGGILDAEEARARLDSGASLVQAYAGYVYGGPSFPARLARAAASRR